MLDIPSLACNAKVSAVDLVETEFSSNANFNGWADAGLVEA